MRLPVSHIGNQRIYECISSHSRQQMALKPSQHDRRRAGTPCLCTSKRVHARPSAGDKKYPLITFLASAFDIEALVWCILT